MAAKVVALVVVMDGSVSEEYAKLLANAIELFDHVASVKIEPDSIEHVIARERVRHELKQAMWKVLESGA